MSPLTPTLTEKIPTTPIISGGSFEGLPHFAQKAREALDLVNPRDKDMVVERQAELARRKSHIESLKESQKGYDFLGYEERLLLSDAEIEDILEEKIFRKDGEMTELWKSFYEYLEILTEGKSEELKMKMKRKLVREFRLEDQVYEGNIWGISVNTVIRQIEYENKEQFFEDIEMTGRFGVKNLDLSDNGLREYKLSEKLDAKDFIELVRVAGQNGIRSLNLWRNKLAKKLDAWDFIKFIQVAGESGIKYLRPWSDCPSEKFDAKGLIELVQVIGNSGIRNLDFQGLKLSEELDTKNLIELVRVAGTSGIKILDLWNNDLAERFDIKNLIELVQVAGISGIKILDLRNNNLAGEFDIKDLIELVRVAGTSGIKNLGLCWNIPFKKLDTKDFIELVRNSGESGIKYLDLSWNNLSRRLNTQQKQEIDNIAKQYSMKLNCEY